MKMKNRIKSAVKKLVCGLMAAALMVCSPAGELVSGTGLTITAEAAVKKPTCAKTKTTYVTTGVSAYDGVTPVAVGNGYAYSKGTSFPLYLKVSNLASGAKITNVKSSNTKVLTAKYDASKYKKGLIVTFKGYGTSKITFTVKQNNKTYKLTCKYTFKKTPTPFSSLKVGGKQLASKYTGRTTYTYDTNKKSVKISYKAKSGYKIVRMCYYDSEGKEVKVKNNSTIQIPEEGIAIIISYRYNKVKYGSKGYGANYDSVAICLTR